jgi:hypothetical protein
MEAIEIYKKILRPVVMCRCGGGIWKITTNQELGELHKTNDMEESNKRSTLEWLRHV